MTYYGQELAIQQLAVAVGVEGNLSVCEKQTALDGVESFSGGVLLQALTQ